MKILGRDYGYNNNSYVIRLDPAEAEWPDRRIITACDRHGKLSDEDWQKILDGDHPCHFGGYVERRADGTAYVKVYTD